MRARGNKGELAGVSFSDRPERFQAGRRVFVRGVPYELEAVWYHKEQPIFKFKGVDSISAAEALAGAEVTVPGEERFPLDEDEVYFSDLIGCRMVDHGTGREVGTVTGWQEPGGPVLLEVDKGRVLVPFVRAMVKRIDPAAREIRVELPDGLEDLNR